MAGGIGIIGGYGLRTRTTAVRMADIEQYVHNLAKNSLQMDSSGNVDITGVINIGASGGIYQGTGTFASPTTGLKIYNDGTNGLIELWDASAKAFSLTHTKLLFGSNVTAAATTALAVFAEDTTYNSESLGAGDVLLGDNSSNKANLLWDKSAGKLQLRGGTTMQCEIGTDGKLYAGAGAVVLDANGISLTEGIATVNKVRWVNGANTLANFSSYGTDGIGVNLLLTLSGISSAQNAAVFSLTSTPFSASGGGTQKIILDTTAGITAQLGDNAGSNKFRFHDSGDVLVGSVDSDGSAIFKGGLNVGTASGATTGQIKTSDHIIIADGKELQWSDVNLYRSAANSLKTDDSMQAVSGFLAPLSNGTAIWGIDAQATGTSVADTATYQPFGNTNAFSGLFLVNATDSGSVGLFMQGGNTVVLISESVASTFSVTQGTASRVNVYLSTNVVTIENRRGVTVEIRTFAIRTRNFY